MREALINVKKLHKTFPKQEGRKRVEALTDINISVHEGEFLVLLGPSGCGKSTFLRILAGLDHGTGTLGYGHHFDPTKVSFVFQNFGLLPWLSVAENISLGLIGAGMEPTKYIKEVRDIMARFGLLQFRDHMPSALSGGMRQRVGLARAFVTKPSVIFLDEPFSELDFFTASDLRALLLELWKTEKTTVVMVSHYIEEAVSLSDRIAIFTARPGHISNIIHNTLPRPRDPRSPEFFALEDEILKHFAEHREVLPH